MLQKILIISNDFPPPIKGGNMRIYKFVKYLVRKKFEVYVICNNWDVKNSINKDSKLSIELDGVNFFSIPALGRSKNVINVNSIKPTSNKISFKSLFKIFLTNLVQPDLYTYTWNEKAIKTASDLILRYNISHVITTSPPHSTQLIGLKLKKRFKNKINWIVDFRDLWSLSHTYPFKFSLKKYFNTYLEKKVLKAADKVIFVSNGIRELTLNKFKFNYKSYVISNGYDNDDFLNLNKSLLIDTNNINISYIGTMFGPQANHKLIEGINTFSKKLNSNSPIKFNFIGEFEFKILQAINANNLIRLINKISHSEALNLMFTSQILILVLPNDFEGKIAYSGKFFEYIKIGKPILGIVPDGEVAEIIKKYNLGEIANPDDIIEIKNKINKIIENINSYTKLPVEELYKYSREAQTEYLINLIHE